MSLKTGFSSWHSHCGGVQSKAKGDSIMDIKAVRVEEPKLARFLFSDTRAAWLWLPLRLYLGYMWFDAGWHKFIDPKGMGSGEARSEERRVGKECGSRWA